MKGSRLSIEYLKGFRDLAKTKSFRQAAALNFLTQSAISQQLAYLEKHFGKKLIERERGQFFLTPEGHQLLEAANAIIDIEKNLMETIKKAPNEISGTIRVESAYSVGLHSLNTLVRNFIKKHPKIVLDVEYSHSNRILADLIAGTCDVGIVILPVPRADKFDIYPFMKEKLVYVCSPYHANAKKKSVSLTELKNEPFVAFDKNQQTRQIVDDIFHQHHVNVNIIHEGENIETLKRVVEVGGGVSILPEATVLDELKSKSLCCSLIKEGPFYREAGLATRRGKHLTRAGQTFLHWLFRQRR
jgi:DNA-binding transcriptional LysR family regulator